MARSTESSTQQHLPIAGVQDDTVIMNDGSLRVALRCEPINFDLKSELEQNGIIYAYQGFLNSLDFPIQIVVQSKKLDLERYLLKLADGTKQQTNELLRIQTEDYVGFVRRLISVANIMSKRFYVVVSYSGITAKAATAGLTNIFHKAPTGPLMDADQFSRFRGEAHSRANIIAGGLARMGVKAETVTTQGLIELFYGIYNPDVATEERISGDVAVIQSGVVRAPDALVSAQAASDLGYGAVPTNSPDEELPYDPMAYTALPTTAPAANTDANPEAHPPA